MADDTKIEGLEQPELSTNQFLDQVLEEAGRDTAIRVKKPYQEKSAAEPEDTKQLLEALARDKAKEAGEGQPIEEFEAGQPVKPEEDATSRIEIDELDVVDTAQTEPAAVRQADKQIEAAVVDELKTKGAGVSSDPEVNEPIGGQDAAPEPELPTIAEAHDTFVNKNGLASTADAAKLEVGTKAEASGNSAPDAQIQGIPPKTPIQGGAADIESNAENSTE